MQAVLLAGFHARSRSLQPLQEAKACITPLIHALAMFTLALTGQSGEGGTTTRTFSVLIKVRCFRAYALAGRVVGFDLLLGKHNGLGQYLQKITICTCFFLRPSYMSLLRL